MNDIEIRTALAELKTKKRALEIEIREVIREKLDKFYEETGIEINEIEYSRRRDHGKNWVSTQETKIILKTDL